jgi:O-antigen/teichoic acid export membrane protein
MFSKESVTGQSIFLMVGRTIGTITSMVIPLILVRIFSQNDYGVYKFIFLIYANLVSILPLGMSQSLFYFVPYQDKKKDVYVKQTFLFLLLAGMVILLVAYLFTYRLTPLFQTEHSRIILFLISLSCFLGISSSLLDPLMIAEKKAGLASIVIAISDVLSAVLIIIFSITTNTIIGLMVGFTIYGFLRFIYCFFYINRSYGFVFKGAYGTTWKDQLSYALPLGLANLITVIQLNLHQFVVSFSFSASVFAIYSVATFQVPLVRVWYSSIADVILVRMTEFRRSNETQKILKLWLNSVMKLFIAFFPIFIFLFVFSEEFIVILFTRSYIEAVPVFRIFLFTLLLYSVNCHSVLRSYAETRFIFNVNLATLITNTGLLWVFVRTLGIWGAAFSTVIVGVFSNILMLWKISKLLNIGIFKLFPIKEICKISFCGLASGLLMLPLKGIYSPNGLLTGLLFLGLSFIFYSSLYGIGIWVTKVIPEDEQFIITRYILRLKKSLLGMVGY